MGRKLVLFLIFAVLALAQQTDRDSKGQPVDRRSDKNAGKRKDEPPAKQQPAPLFGGQLGTRSSRNTKESATLGFNGIDPSGKVDKRLVAASASSKDVEEVRKMDTRRPTPMQVAAFMKEGGLIAR